MSESQPHEIETRPQSRREWHGWIRSLILPLGLVALIVGGLFWLQSNREGARQEPGFGTVELPAALNVTGKSPSATAERAAPDFRLRTLDGGEVRLSELQGRPVVVNFWASWCAPCRAEIPELIEMYESRQETGLQLLGVNLREADEQIAGFAEDFGISYPVLLDRDGQVASTWRIGGPNNGLPSTYFIDSSGVVRLVVFGFLTEEKMSEGLALILQEAG